MRNIKTLTTVLILAATVLTGCSQTPTKPTASLYDRLGGKEAITAVVDDLSANVAADSRINHRFAKTNIKQFKAHMVDLLCMGSGGPCTYKGLDMKTVHTGMKISDTEFGAMAENAVKTMNKFNVPAQEQSEVMAMLGGMKGDIVNR
jgi:hemoglobin